MPARLALIALLALAAPAAVAETYPERPIAMVQRLQPLGVAPAHVAPVQFRALIASDTARWADIVKAAGITVQ